MTHSITTFALYGGGLGGTCGISGAYACALLFPSYSLILERELIPEDENIPNHTTLKHLLCGSLILF